MIFSMIIHNENDRNKMEQLWAMHQGLMFHEAKKFFSIHADAEDAVSEASIKIIHNLHKIDEIASYQTKAFLVYIVRSVSIDILRKAKGKMEESVEIIEGLPDSRIDLLSDMVIKEGYATIKEAIKSLPLPLKDVVYLSLVHGYTHAEIAGIMDITEAASKMRLHRAKNEIKRRLVGGNNDE